MAKKQDRGTRNRFYDGYELARWRKWKGFRDSWVDFREWLTEKKISGELLKADPVRAFKALTYYHWMAPYLASGSMVDRTIDDAHGEALLIAHKYMQFLLKSNVEALIKIIKTDERFGKTDLAKKTVIFEQDTSPILIGGFPNLQNSCAAWRSTTSCRITAPV